VVQLVKNSLPKEWYRVYIRCDYYSVTISLCNIAN
jgi:hypothetical protein